MNSVEFNQMDVVIVAIVTVEVVKALIKRTNPVPEDDVHVNSPRRMLQWPHKCLQGDGNHAHAWP